MKLLFDQNLSPALVSRLADLFPGSVHVQIIGMDCADDEEIWEYALANSFAIVTKDEDYSNLCVLRGKPAKVVWLQLGNCSTSQVEQAFRLHFPTIEAFEKDDSLNVLVLS